MPQKDHAKYVVEDAKFESGKLVEDIAQTSQKVKILFKNTWMNGSSLSTLVENKVYLEILAVEETNIEEKRNKC